MTDTGGIELFDETWLNLREPADAAARSTELVQQLQAYLDRGGDDATIAVLDLGSGTGSTARWLAPQLPGPQEWLLLDHNADLLVSAVRRCAELVDAAGAEIQVDTVATDLSDLDAADLGRMTVVTASALLDLLNRAQVADLAARCADAGVAALLTLSVAGRVSLNPPDPADAAIAAAFDAHQRRLQGDQPLLGPDAVDVASAAFETEGFVVRVVESPWRLGPDSGELSRVWLDGWLAAAAVQDAALGARLASYRRTRSAQIAAGELSVVVGHHDLLALPPSPGTAPRD